MAGTDCPGCRRGSEDYGEVCSVDFDCAVQGDVGA